MKHDTRALTARPYLRTQIDPNYFPDALLDDYRALAYAEERTPRKPWLVALFVLAFVGCAVAVFW
jgi:hypothetical protein